MTYLCKLLFSIYVKSSYILTILLVFTQNSGQCYLPSGCSRNAQNCSMMKCKDQCRGESGPEPAELCDFKDLVLTHVHHYNEFRRQNNFMEERDLFSSFMELDCSEVLTLAKTPQPRPRVYVEARDFAMWQEGQVVIHVLGSFSQLSLVRVHLLQESWSHILSSDLRWLDLLKAISYHWHTEDWASDMWTDKGQTIYQA